MTRINILLMLLLVPALLSAQVEWNGSVDFAAGLAGEDSKFISNEVATEFRRTHLSIQQINLFLFAPVGEDFAVNARIQFDTWGSGKLNQPRITLASLVWEKPDTKWRLSVGRFVSPFGLYPRRQLAADNLFAQAPLAYGYFINLSDQRGFWPNSGDSGIYGPDDVGLTTVYFGGYNTGLMLNWIFIPDVFSLDLVAANAAPASQADYTNLPNAAGLIKINFQPLIYWQQGISFSYGSFMQQAGVNTIYDRLERFKQMVFGTDVIFAHSYFELSGEFIYSFWKVPGFFNGAFKTDNSGELGEFDLENYSYYVDFKIEPPFLTGMYVAFRYESILFQKYSHPQTTSLISLNPWDHDVDRFAVALGYKLDRSVLVKVVYSDQKTKNLSADPKDDSLQGILTVSF